MRADGRFGGHIVQGHVDGTGKFLALDRVRGADDYWLRIEIPPELARYVIFKGSLCIEGIGLTVAQIEGDDGDRGDNSTHGKDDQPEVAQAGRSGKPRSGHGREIRGKDDQGRMRQLNAHGGAVGGRGILSEGSGISN